jgi:hypothetical protein
VKLTRLGQPILEMVVRPWRVAGYRYLLRTVDGHYVGEYVTDRYRWAEGDHFTGPGGREFRIVTIEGSGVFSAFRATWTVELVAA